MFDILTEQEAKKKKEEEVLEKFFNTLEQFDEDNDIDNNIDEELISVDDAPIRRRVIPTIPGRKPINSRSKRDSTSNGKKMFYWQRITSIYQKIMRLVLYFL